MVLQDRWTLSQERIWRLHLIIICIQALWQRQCSFHYMLCWWHNHYQKSWVNKTCQRGPVKILWYARTWLWALLNLERKRDNISIPNKICNWNLERISNGRLLNNSYLNGFKRERAWSEESLRVDGRQLVGSLIYLTTTRTFWVSAVSHWKNATRLLFENQQGRSREFEGIAHREQEAWGGRDCWWDAAFKRWPGSVEFSCGFRRHGGRLLEWLDHFYISDWAACRGGGRRGSWPRPALLPHSQLHLWARGEEPHLRSLGTRLVGGGDSRAGGSNTYGVHSSMHRGGHESPAQDVGEGIRSPQGSLLFKGSNMHPSDSRHSRFRKSTLIPPKISSKRMGRDLRASRLDAYARKMASFGWGQRRWWTSRRIFAERKSSFPHEQADAKSRYGSASPPPSPPRWGRLY